MCKLSTMETKHTSGPWGYRNGLVASGGPTKTIASVNSLFISNEEHEANCKLIAAAPQMLEVILRVLNTSEDHGREGCTWGDTEFDSLSAAAGHNQCLDNIKSILLPVIKLATE